jgi:preprotein translocase subunit SecA
VLNAKYHAKEAEIVAQAGRRSAVTVATNMAGRGTDIVLGGNPEFLAAAELRQRGLSQEESPQEYDAAWEDALLRWKKQCDDEAEEVIDAGGLYVLGTERHESRRIDNQLRGRSGRQGDPGESRFYLSLQDELMRRFRAGAVEAVMDRFNIPEDVPIESKMVTRQIKSAQTQIEAQNAEIRKNVLKYDEVLNKQRMVIYAERKRVLNGEDLHEQVQHMIDDVATAYVVGATAEGVGAEDWDLEKLWVSLKQLYPIGVTIEDLEEEAGGAEGLDTDFIAAKLREDAQAAYEQREEELGADAMRELERQVLLAVIDRKWREHLYEMDYLQEGVGLRAYAQRDPLVEYQREGFDMFSQMLDGIKEEAVGFLFNLDVQVEEAPAAPAAGVPLPKATAPGAQPQVEIHAKGLGGSRLPRALQYSAPVIDGAAGSGGGVAVEQAPALGVGDGGGKAGGKSGAIRRSGPSSPTAAGARKPSPGQAVGSGPSRNAPCYCGSGKKYKRCHGAPGAA